MRDSPRTALTVGRWYGFNIFNLFQKSGLDKLMPEMKMDDFLFSPSGYSMNGIMKEDMVKKLDSSENLESPGKGRDPSFVTIHVTPQVQIDSSQSHLSLFQKSIQPSCSYASFETNSLSASTQLIRQVYKDSKKRFRYRTCCKFNHFRHWKIGHFNDSGARNFQPWEVHPKLLFNRGKLLLTLENILSLWGFPVVPLAWGIEKVLTAAAVEKERTTDLQQWGATQIYNLKIFVKQIMSNKCQLYVKQMIPKVCKCQLSSNLLVCCALHLFPIRSCYI